MDERKLKVALDDLSRRVQAIEEHGGLRKEGEVAKAAGPMKGVDVYRGQGDIDWGHRSDARAEASDLLEAIAPLPKPDILKFSSGAEAAIWLDLEKAIINLSEEQGLTWIMEWLQVVEKRWPVGLYTSKQWLDEEATPNAQAFGKLASRPDGSRRPIWVARYGPNNGIANPGYDPEEKVADAWGTWDIWQFTSKGTVPGVPGLCDLNLGRIVA